MRLAATTALLVGLALAGCGGDESEETADEAGGTEPGAAEGAAGDETPRELAGSFPDSPQLVLRFSERPAEWPARVSRGGSSAGYDGGLYVVRAPAGETLRVAAERPADPATQGVLLETQVRLPAPPARAGLFCRGSADGRSGYSFTVDADGRWRIDRLDGGATSALGSGRAPIETTEPGQPTLLRFLCGAGLEGENLTLGYTINATELQFVNDPTSVAPGGGLGLLLGAGSGAASASFIGLAVSYAD